MIVTRNWLQEFVDIRDVSDEGLSDTFNAIGLEVASVKYFSIPSKIVVGEVIACEKHPDADKLNICSVDIGYGKKQIVCGAANVRDAKYVAVATIGAVMHDGLEIKPTTLRGVDSDGMICSSDELGLPNIGSGIMILDESIGKLVVGKELREYEILNDTLFELEITPNRGDCLSIYGVARDLSAFYNRDLLEIKEEIHSKKVKLGISREASFEIEGEIDSSCEAKLANVLSPCYLYLKYKLRVASIEMLEGDNFANMLTYINHTTGVTFWAFDANYFKNDESKIVLKLTKDDGLNVIKNSANHSSIASVSQDTSSKMTPETTQVVLFGNYIHPDILNNSLIGKEIVKDNCFYNASRGSNPNIDAGMLYATNVLTQCEFLDFYDGVLTYKSVDNVSTILVDCHDLSAIIGQDMERASVVSILTRLGFKISPKIENILGITLPRFRPDIKNIQDIAEEVLRIIGIDNITAKPLKMDEKMFQSSAIFEHRFKREIKNRAVANGFFETVSYAFADRALQIKYGFDTLKKDLELLNPIVTEMNTLRSTLLINLLQSAKRNYSFSKNRVPLFEIGSVFDANRNESEKIAFIWSGQADLDAVSNQGKPNGMVMSQFVVKIGQIVGNFSLQKCTHQNGLLHPYQSADIVIDSRVVGFISKLHPLAQEDFDLAETFIAQIDVDVLLPKHIVASDISKFQPSVKDLSVVVDSKLDFSSVKEVIEKMEIGAIKEFYPIDVYHDLSLGNKKSLTLRFVLQSTTKTLEDKDIEETINGVLVALQESIGASLR